MEAEKKIPNKKHDGKRNSGEEEVIMCLTLTHFRTFPFYQALFTETLSDSSENLWAGGHHLDGSCHCELKPPLCCLNDGVHYAGANVSVTAILEGERALR